MQRDLVERAGRGEHEAFDALAGLVSGILRFSEPIIAADVNITLDQR